MPYCITDCFLTSEASYLKIFFKAIHSRFFFFVKTLLILLLCHFLDSSILWSRDLGKYMRNCKVDIAILKDKKRWGQNSRETTLASILSESMIHSLRLYEFLDFHSFANATDSNGEVPLVYHHFLIANLPGVSHIQESSQLSTLSPKINI